MDRAWKNERGMTLLELMAAVVILVLVAIPLTSIGTTVYRWYQEDEQKTQAVLAAEQRIVKLKKEYASMVSGLDSPAEIVDPMGEYNLQTKVELSQHLMISEDKNSSVSDLIDVIVQVTGPDLQNPPQHKVLTTLATTIRQKTVAGVKP